MRLQHRLQHLWIGLFVKRYDCNGMSVGRIPLYKKAEKKGSLRRTRCYLKRHNQMMTPDTHESYLKIAGALNTIARHFAGNLAKGLQYCQNTSFRCEEG